MPRACSQCGCTEIDTDPARGDAVCTNCGTVLEDQIIISEVQYQENAAGGASVIGQFVSNDGTRAQSFRGAYGHGFSSEDSRKLTLENGYKRLKEMGGQLRMHHSSIETAFGFFKLAVAHRFTSGRKMEYVLASCLYLVCRVDPGGSEDLELMLIDFSDLIQVNVHVLGRIFVQLATELCQNIRIVDPIIYIRRFANQLQFGDKINKVVESASRLVARMKRDWMHTGRRPAGLCGAALLISSRMHNFNRTIDQIIKVVKVCESTVRKRLLEFENTPSAQLTIEEFDNVDLEEEQDPPCFTEGKKKAKKAQVTEDISENMIKELNKFEKNINKSLKRKHIPSIEARPEGELDLDKAVKLIGEETVKQVAGEDWKDGTWKGLDPVDEELQVTDNIENNQAGKSVEQENESNIMQPETEECEGKAQSSKVEDGELDLTGIDDDEIDQLIVSEEEAQHKAKWFDLEFGEHMEIVRDREEKRRIKEEAAAKKKEKNPRTKKKKKKGGYDLETELAECMEILKKDMREKKFSDKINYNVLNTLDASASTECVSTEPIEIPSDTPTTDRKPHITNRFNKSSLSDHKDIKKPLGKRVRIEVNTQEIKKSKLEPVEEIKPVILVEDNHEPLPYTDEGPAEEIEDDEEEEDEDDDEAGHKILSARQLLSQEATGYEEEEDDYFFYDVH
ncbi:transcription factor IIIB 90 kDa subunit-like isoform X2 [Physella acuta]|uniref:transcription factor IIIB 90 kDa subunit-like isoform X2 n=1 Tax=Physella acuta TaxID=109671 RepID=UPI0027DDCD7A|nr:transcription factor IIIB 90 kDa subunit-like isoform X2 [Physella acuta]